MGISKQGLGLAANVSTTYVARELGINANMLGRWYREAGSAGAKAFQGQGKLRNEEMAALKRELARERAMTKSSAITYSTYTR